MWPVAVTRTPASASLLDVLDRVLDKGLVIDAWLRVSVLGLDLVTLQARVVVASVELYLDYVQPVVGRAAPKTQQSILRETVEDRLPANEPTPPLTPVRSARVALSATGSTATPFAATNTRPGNEDQATPSSS